MLKVRFQGLAWLCLLAGVYFLWSLMDGNEDVHPGFPPILDFIALLWFCFGIWVIFVRKAIGMILSGNDVYSNRIERLEENEMMRCNYCNVEHKVVNKEKHLKKCNINPHSPIAKLEAKRKKDNDPNLMTIKRKSQLEEIAERVFPNARYFKYKGEKMELTTDIGSFKYSSCNSRSIESIDKEMVADATRGYNRRNKPKSKNKSSVTKSYSGICSQQKRNHSTCGSPTDSRCPRCSRYACGSCRGSRTYNGRRVCEACNRNMSGD